MTTAESNTIAGAGVDRVDGPLKVTGAAPYPSDFDFPGLAPFSAVREGMVWLGWPGRLDLQ